MLAAAATACALLPALAGGRVLGADERRAPGDDEAELVQAMGLVFCAAVVDGQRRVGAGTGTVVGSRSTILTAAHVFMDAAGRQGPAVEFDPVTDCVFRQYDAHGTLVRELGFTQASFGAYRGGASDPNQDWAVLRTVEALPDISEPLRFPAQARSHAEFDGLPIRMLAFHRDIRARLRLPLLSEGSLLAVDYAGFPRLAHTADMERMSSGAAIVHRTADGTHVVVGINRSAANLGEFNLAVPLSRELLEALRSFAYGQVSQQRIRLAACSAAVAAVVS